MAIGLGLDAFSLAAVFGICQKVCPLGAKLRLSLSFGSFQFFMPLIGFWGGLPVARLAISFGHWIAFFVLAIVGGRMIYQGWNEKGERTLPDFSRGWPLITASIATSIDALAVGFSFALLESTIWLQALIIGIVAAFMTYIGVSLGHRLGKEVIPKPEIIGGIAISLVGLKILLDGLI